MVTITVAESLAAPTTQPLEQINFSSQKDPELFFIKPIPLPDLANMPTEWIEQLRQAAIAIDSDLILQLIQQISLVKIDLAQGLTKMVKNFEYDEILELTQEELNSRE